MNEYPKISIITPSLNQGEFVEKAIQSILTQNYPNIEYIIMDGGSEDGTLDVLKKYSGHPVIKWVSEPDNGQTHAINKGLSIATGSILAYLNTDDLLLSGSLQKIAEIFMMNPSVMWVTGKCMIINEENVEIRKLITYYKNFMLSMKSRPLLLVTNYISQPATFWRKQAMDKVGVFDEDLKYVMDYEYWLRLYRQYPLLYIPEYLAAFKIHPASKTTSDGHKDGYVNEEKKIIERHTAFAPLVFLHNLHRAMMTAAYSFINQF